MANCWPRIVRRAKYNRANQLWHSDASFRAIPSKYSLLYAETVASKDGETEFADERGGWEALDLERKERAERMVAGHSLMTSRIKTGFTTFTAEEGVSLKPVPQPVVRTHDPKGRKNLFLGSHAGEVYGEDPEEGTQVPRGIAGLHHPAPIRLSAQMDGR